MTTTTVWKWIRSVFQSRRRLEIVNLCLRCDEALLDDSGWCWICDSQTAASEGLHALANEDDDDTWHDEWEGHEFGAK